MFLGVKPSRQLCESKAGNELSQCTAALWDPCETLCHPKLSCTRGRAHAHRVTLLPTELRNRNYREQQGGVHRVQLEKSLPQLDERTSELCLHFRFPQRG